MPESSIITQRFVAGIGVASIALGLFDYLRADRLAAKIGIDDGKAFRAAGIREITTGIAAVAFPRSRLPILGRLVGDVADIVLLSTVAAKPDNPRRSASLMVVGIVAVITTVDLLAARWQRVAS